MALEMLFLNWNGTIIWQVKGGNGIPHPSNNLISNDNTDKQTMKKLHRLASTQRDHILLQE